MSQILVIPHRFKKIGIHNLVVRRIVSDILLVLGLKKVENHCFKATVNRLIHIAPEAQVSGNGRDKVYSLENTQRPL
jgi:hypothetical protein